jgi:hypothetical protein
LDDCWTLTYNPLSEYIHFDPLGLLLTSVQEITNDLISLILQTIEHGIPQTFADPSTLNFEQYRNTEIAPGAIFPAKAKSGKTLSDGFYTVSTATLSQEVQPFSEQIQELGQFVSGALPSLFGGNQANSSRTAAQYSMSRAQAQQRLQTPWKMINFWWKNIFSKMVPAYIKTMLEDERVVKQVGDSFVNVVIKKAQMDGKIGNVTVEASDELPHGWAQVHDTLMQLIQTNNPDILQMIGSPENIGILAEAIGLTDFHVPGEDDREKQYEEIQILIKSQPMPQPIPQPPVLPQQMHTGPGVPPQIMQQQQQPIPQPPQMQNMPSVMPELLVDNHAVEAGICRSWLVSETGRQCKIDNPPGYQNVLLHLQIHIQMLQQLNAPPPGPQGPPSNNAPPPSSNGNGVGKGNPNPNPLKQGTQKQMLRPAGGTNNAPVS